MIFKPRTYQAEAKGSVLAYWAECGGNPLVDMATGLGKSITIADLAHYLVTTYQGLRCLVLAHVKELVEQDYKALIGLHPNASVGIYAAALGRRDTSQKIIFGMIQSLYRRAKEIGPIDVIFIDEAQLVGRDTASMYGIFLAAMREMVPDLRVCGFTATPFRTDSGRLDEGAGALFDKIVYSYGLGRAIEDGWLTPLIGKNGAVEIDVSSVPRRGDDFVSGALETASNQEWITQAAVAEIVALGKSRRTALIFCAGVKHAQAVCDEMNRQGRRCAMICGDTPQGQRDALIDACRRGETDLTNANVLTTGTDIVGIDLIVLLRSTLSAVLLAQMCGRGTRVMWPRGFSPSDATAAERRDAIASGPKTNCLLLDYAGNIRRHGPVDLISADRKPGSKKAGVAAVSDVRAKECPTCKSLAALNAQRCAFCGHEWSMDRARHEAEADDVAILSRDLKKQAPEEIAVVTWAARRHMKQGSPDSLRVTYSAGLMSYPEWVLFQHSGPMRFRAEQWWKRHGGSLPVPDTVDEAIVRWAEVSAPAFISVRKNGKWFDIVGRRFAETHQEQAA